MDLGSPAQGTTVLCHGTGRHWFRSREEMAVCAALPERVVGVDDQSTGRRPESLDPDGC